MRIRIAALVVLGLVFSTGLAFGEGQEKEKAAVVAAEKWLGLIDDGRYDESWQQAAGFFRNAVKQDQWAQSLQSVRKPLGKLISRKVKSRKYTTSLPGAPDGKYVVIEFDTSFKNKKSAIETVTPMMEGDGSWKVSGYYMK